MRQRTKLAQALVADPELVLLDEPTAGLDPIGREEMLALVARLSTFGISVVLATHLLDDVQAVCDHVVMIDAGRLVLAGPTTQLLERAGTVRVDVGRSSDGLVDALARHGLAATVLDDASLEISGNGRSGDEVLDTVRDVVAQLGLPLHALSTRHASLDEVFLRTAGEIDERRGTSRSLGAVYDRGYRPYEGSLGGERAATFALYRTSIRRALGIRRSWRQKVLPWSLLAIVTVPAIVNVGVGYVTRNTPAEGFKFITYQEYVGVSSALLLFVAVTAPDVVCPDRRHRVLPLIFARPLVGRDYVLAKVGAIATILFGFSFLPQVVLFVGQMLVSDAALDYLRDNADVLWKVPVAVVLLAVYYAAIGVAVASLTSRRIVGGVALLALALVPSVLSGAVLGSDADGHGPIALINLLALPLYLRDIVFTGHIEDAAPLGGVTGGGLLAALIYLVVVLAAMGLLFLRYREPDA